MHFHSLGLVFPVLGFALAMALQTAAQHSSGNDPELQELGHYTLTMDNVTRYVDTLKELQPMMEGKPEIEDAVTVDADKHESLDQLSAKVASHPEIAAVMKKHGFTTRQFFLEEACFLQASLGSAMKPAGESDAAYGQKTNINPANLAFVRDHQAELRALTGGKRGKASD